MSRLDGVVLRLRRVRCLPQRLLEAADLGREGGRDRGRDRRRDEDGRVDEVRLRARARENLRTGLRFRVRGRVRTKPRIKGSSARQPRGAAAAKGVADLVSSRQVSQHSLERLGRARRIRLLIPPELARVAAYLDRHVHPIVGEQRCLERAPQRRDEHSLRTEATDRTLPRRGLHPAQLGQRRVRHVASRRVGLRLPVPEEEDTARPASTTTAVTGPCHGRIPSSFFCCFRGLVFAAHPNRETQGLTCGQSPVRPHTDRELVANSALTGVISLPAPLTPFSRSRNSLNGPSSLRGPSTYFPPLTPPFFAFERPPAPVLRLLFCDGLHVALIHLAWQY